MNDATSGMEESSYKLWYGVNDVTNEGENLFDKSDKIVIELKLYEIILER